eukprot:489652_1
MDGEESGSHRPPSSVLHLRNIPAFAEESKIRNVVGTFGKIKRIVYLNYKRQALIEMNDLATAKNIIAYHQGHNSKINGQRVFFDFSVYENLDSDPARPPSRILLVTIFNAMARVSTDAIFANFAECGRVGKIILFEKRFGLQALVEMSSLEEAARCSEVLQGRELQGNCGNLWVQYSTMTKLTLPRDDPLHHRSHDYSGERPRAKSDAVATNVSAAAQRSRAVSAPLGGLLPLCAPPSPQHPPFELVEVLPTSPDTLYSSIHFPAIAHPNFQIPESICDPSSLPRHNLFGPGPSFVPSPVFGPMDPYGRTPPPPGLTNPNHGPIIDPAPNGVLLVSNLHAENTTPDALFNLFGAFGDVFRVKILKDKPGRALVQMVNPEHALKALSNLNGASLWGLPMHIQNSKFNVVEMPSQNDKYNSDYSNSTKHRFKWKHSRNLQNICPPSKVLHVTGLSSKIEPLDLFRLWGDRFEVKRIQRFIFRPHMALIEMANPDVAAQTLIALHNSKLSGSTVKISFSKKHLLDKRAVSFESLLKSEAAEQKQSEEKPQKKSGEIKKSLEKCLGKPLEKSLGELSLSENRSDGESPAAVIV